MMKNFFNYLIILLIVTGCTIEGNIYDQADYRKYVEIFYAERVNKSYFPKIKEPPMPNKLENEKSYLGIDSNKDGIRDDIELVINRIAKTEESRNILRNYYKEKISLTQIEDQNKLLADWKQFKATEDCIKLYYKMHRDHFDLEEGYEPERIIEIMTIYNSKRGKFYNSLYFKFKNEIPPKINYLSQCNL